MPMPKSVTKINRDGVEFISSVDKAQYTIQELIRAAQRDTAKLIRRRMIEKLKRLPGMRRNRRIYSSTQYWIRRKEGDLQIGFKHDSWYGAKSELGTQGQPARGILRNTVFENIDQIRIIQGQYLSAVNDENKALGLIDESEAVDQNGADD